MITFEIVAIMIGFICLEVIEELILVMCHFHFERSWNGL